MMNEGEMTTRDKLEKILRLADELLIEMDEDIEESDEDIDQFNEDTQESDQEPRKRVRGPGYVGEKPENQGTRWSKADDEYLRLMVHSNWTTEKMRLQLKRTVKSVKQREETLKRLGWW